MLPDWDAGAAAGRKHGAEEHELQRHESEQLCRQLRHQRTFVSDKRSLHEHD